jgi:hypothetical protein
MTKNSKSIFGFNAYHLSLVAGAAVAATSVAAADLPSGKASPVKYVKVCDQYGSGFFTIPGSDTCTRLGGTARFETQYTPGRDIYSVSTGKLTQSASQQDTNGFEARGIIYVDSHTPSEMGDARTYLRIRSQLSSGNRAQGAANNFAESYPANAAKPASVTLERAYVSWAGFTFGNMSSEWAGMWPSGTVVGGAADFTPGWTNGVKALAYTKKIGDWTFNVALQDRSDTGPNAGSFTPPGLTIPVQASNTAIFTPTTGIDVLGVIRNEGNWGGAEIGLMTGNNSAATATGHQNFTSWAVNSTVKINLPMIAAGDAFLVNLGYGVGANGYAGAPDTVSTLVTDSTNRRILGGILIAPSDLSVTSANGGVYTWGQEKVVQTTALFTHYWSQQWRSHFSVASSTYSTPTALASAGTQLGTVKVWATKAYLVYSPVKDFDIGVEVGYGRDNVTIQNPTAAFVAANSPGLKDSNYTTRLRVIRTF